MISAYRLSPGSEAARYLMDFSQSDSRDAIWPTIAKGRYVGAPLFQRIGFAVVMSIVSWKRLLSRVDCEDGMSYRSLLGTAPCVRGQRSWTDLTMSSVRPALSFDCRI